jgi:hypothetical protein
MRAERFAASRVPSLPPEAESVIRPMRGGALLLAIATCSTGFGEVGNAPASRLFLDLLADRLSPDPSALPEAARRAFSDLCASDLIQPHLDDDWFDPFVMFAAAAIAGERAVLSAIGAPFARVARAGAVIGTTLPDVVEMPPGNRIPTRGLHRAKVEDSGQIAFPLERGDEVQVALTIGWDVPRSDEEAEAIRVEADASRVIALIARV